MQDTAAVVLPATFATQDHEPGTSTATERPSAAALADEVAGRSERALWMATRDAPEDGFFAAGAPWYLTLFGRDSIWTARMLLPVSI